MERREHHSTKDALRPEPPEGHFATISNDSLARYLEYLGKPGLQRKLASFEKELCPYHTLPAHSGYSHSKECKAVEEIRGGDKGNRQFLLGRLEAMRRYEHANQFEHWPKWARNEARRAQSHLLKAKRNVEKYEVVRKKLERRIKQQLGQDVGLFPAGAYSTNLKQFADAVGVILKSGRAYLFGSAQKNILANLLRHFPEAKDKAIAPLLSWSLKRTITRKPSDRGVRTIGPSFNEVGKTSLFTETVNRAKSGPNLIPYLASRT